MKDAGCLTEKVMEKVLRIEVNQDPGTGEYVMGFIEWTDTTYGNDGYWTNRRVSGEDVRGLLKACYPAWDGERQPVCCTDDDLNGEAWKAKDALCYGCPHDCPHKEGGYTERFAVAFGKKDGAGC